MVRVIAIPHGDKVNGLAGESAEIIVNPTLTISGMRKIQALVTAIVRFGPFWRGYVSRFARALDTISVIALALDLDFETIRELGQYASKDGAEVVYYPGHETDDMQTWQGNGMFSLVQIEQRAPEGSTVLVASHRPIIGGLLAHCRGLHDVESVTKTVIGMDPSRSFYVFEVNKGIITLAE